MLHVRSLGADTPDRIARRPRRTAPGGVMTATVDLRATYTIPGDLPIVRRGDSTLQIGTEPPRRMMLLDAPAEAAEVLARFDGATSADEAVARSAGDRAAWRSLLAAMLAAGMLLPVGRGAAAVPAHLRGEHLSLIHRFGAAAADRLLGARGDAVVVLEGEGPVAGATAAILAGCGVGHVYHDGRGSRAAGRTARPPAWAAPPDVRVHRPAPQVPPSVVVLAGRTAPDPARAAQLVTSLIPHLAVSVSPARVVVGPLVLPGRSCCLNCIDRHRTDADPGWPAVARALRELAILPGALATQVAAELAAGQVLDLLDGQHRPDTVNASVERILGSPQVRRRRWPVHPDCGCHLLSGQV